MQVIGVDQSLTDTGVCFNNERLHIQTKKSSDNHEVDILNRIREIYTFIVDKVEDPCNTLLVIEGYSFGSRFSRIFDLGELGHGIKDALFFLGADLLVVTPTQLKKFITGDGKADKKKMMKFANSLYGEEFTNDNICDAFCLMMVGKVFLGQRCALNKEQLKIIKELRKKYAKR